MANPFDSNPFDGEPNSDMQVIKEGLICPECMEDFKSVAEVQQHFTLIHSYENKNDSVASHKLGSQIFGFIDKAKKILKNDDDLEAKDQASGSIVPVKVNNLPSKFFESWRENQLIGQSTSHFKEFKKTRDTRIERYAAETNKLVIRLDKLITDAPTDPEKRKHHEKKIVNWANDVDVKLCPGCAKSFNISRRRHHCRLCGAIMCQSCSLFLDFDFAKKLISPTDLELAEVMAMTNNTKNITQTTITKRGSASSLLSINSSDERHIRVCKDCEALLERRNQEIEDHHSKPIIAQMYDRMYSFVKEADRLILIYDKMYISMR